VDPDPMVSELVIEGLTPDTMHHAIEAVQDVLPDNLVTIADATEIRIAVHQVGHLVNHQVGRRQRLGRLEQVANAVIVRLEESQLVDPGGLRIRRPSPPAAAKAVTYGHASIYVETIDDLLPVAQLVTDAGLGLEIEDRRYLQMAVLLQRTIRPLWIMFCVVVSVALSIAFLSTFVNMWLRVRQKKAEIGILKSCGMPRRHLLAIYAIEGALLALMSFMCMWLGSLALGRGVSLVVADVQGATSLTAPSLPWARLLGHVLGYRQDPTAGTLFELTGAKILIVGLLILVTCVAASSVASFASASQRPSQAITDAPRPRSPRRSRLWRWLRRCGRAQRV